MRGRIWRALLGDQFARLLKGLSGIRMIVNLNQIYYSVLKETSQYNAGLTLTRVALYLNLALNLYLFTNITLNRYKSVAMQVR